MGKISSLLCRELHAQALLTTVIVHIISCALLWKFTLQSLAPCQVTAAIYYSLRVETRTLKLQNGSGHLCSLLFPHFFQNSSAEGKVQGPGPQTKQECIPEGCSESCVVMAPCPWSVLCWSPVGVSRCLIVCRPLWIQVSPLEALQRPGCGWPKEERHSCSWCRVNTHRSPESGRGGSCHTAGTNKLTWSDGLKMLQWWVWIGLLKHEWLTPEKGLMLRSSISG